MSAPLTIGIATDKAQTVIVTTRANGTTRTTQLTPREAYTLAVFAEWFLDESDRPLPNTVDNLPDDVAIDCGSEPCHDCAEPHDRPVFFVANAEPDRLSDVHVVELRRADDLLNLPILLTVAAVLATTHTPEEPTNV